MSLLKMLVLPIATAAAFNAAFPSNVVTRAAASHTHMVKTPQSVARAVRSRAPVMRTDEAPALERVLATLPYVLPAIDGFAYGLYVYQNVPPIGAIAGAAFPFVASFESIPFGGLVFFIGMSLFTRNPNLSRFVRFNIQQALLLDIALIVPGLFGPLTKTFPVELQILGTNFIFYAWVLVVGYALFSNAQGKAPDQVPLLSDAASMQIGPF